MFAIHSTYAVEMAKSSRAEEIKAAEGYHHVRRGKGIRAFRTRAAKPASPAAAAMASRTTPLQTSI